MFRRSIKSVLFLAVLLHIGAPRAVAERSGEVTAIDTARFTLYFGSPAGKTQGDEKPENVRDVADRALDVLDETMNEFTRVFRSEPTQKVVLRFLTPDEFRRQTGAPAWTSAMFYRGEITIPLPKGRAINTIELKRALRHELVHAVVAEISNYKCPAWLDEGVAQLLEGQPNPLLGPALRKWIHENEAMPLAWLQNGFTTLDPSIVPAAYAQSLFSTRVLVDELGFESVVAYLQLLRAGTSDDEAFTVAFGRSPREFHRQITRDMREWATSNQFDP